jgi:predicted nucleic acid-binding protein
VTVVSNTSPLNYLALIGQAEILRQLYGRLLVPSAVIRELEAAETPRLVRAWLAKSPSWLNLRAPSNTADCSLDCLGAGEREAISLTQELKAVLLIDVLLDRHAREKMS